MSKDFRGAGDRSVSSMGSLYLFYISLVIVSRSPNIGDTCPPCLIGFDKLRVRRLTLPKSQVVNSTAHGYNSIKPCLTVERADHWLVLCEMR